MKETRHTLCRACHAGCDVKVDVEDGKPIKVHGNSDNPLYQGFACIKGLSMPEQWASSTRLLHSQKRQADGTYVSIPVDQALREIAAKLQQLIAQHGSRCVASYSGTMAANSSPVTSAMTTAWMKAVKTRMGFNSNTIDQPGKAVAMALFGSWMAPADNFSDANVALLIGSNPLVAMSGGIPHTNPGRTLTDALNRGLTLLVIDPRRSDTAKRASQHLQVKPGHDVELLASMIRTILQEKLEDADFVKENIDGVDALKQIVAPFTAEWVSQRAGISADEILLAARTFATCGPGVATAGTGPNMSGDTTLLEYLIRCLNAICGRFQRAGDTVVAPPCLSPKREFIAQAMPPFADYAYGFGEKMRVRNLANTAAGMPTAALADEILLPGEKKVRALISHGGNPVAAWPDQLKTIDAMRSLELLVQIDTQMSATARMADYVIAVKHPLEMAAISLSQEYLADYATGFGTTASYAQYAAAVVAPPEGSDLLEDWQVWYGLAQKMDLQLTIKPVSFSGVVRVPGHALDMQSAPDTEDLLDKITEGSRIPLAEIRQHQGGKLYPDPVETVKPKAEGWTGKMDAGNARMMADLTSKLEQSAAEVKDFPFRLISRRQINVLNSTGRDIPRQTRGLTHNPAYLHPEDVKALNLTAGQRVEIRSARAAIPAIVGIDASLRQGVVSMAHSWGDVPERDSEVETIGANTGRLCSVDTDYEAYTGMPRMSNIPVAIIG